MYIRKTARMERSIIYRIYAAFVLALPLYNDYIPSNRRDPTGPNTNILRTALTTSKITPLNPRLSALPIPTARPIGSEWPDIAASPP